ncbi:unnamed protein product [Cunninghamella blakesleeana]
MINEKKQKTPSEDHNKEYKSSYNINNGYKSETTSSLLKNTTASRSFPPLSSSSTSSSTSLKDGNDKSNMMIKEEALKISRNTYLLLYEFEKGSFGESSLSQFNDKLASILNTIQPSFINSKTFAKLVDILILALTSEQNHNAFSFKQKTSTYRYSTVGKQKSPSFLINGLIDTIYENAIHFVSVLMNYICDYVWIPEDLLPILELLVLLNRSADNVIDSNQFLFIEKKFNKFKERYYSNPNLDQMQQLMNSLDIYINNKQPMSQQQFNYNLDQSLGWEHTAQESPSSASPLSVKSTTPNNQHQNNTDTLPQGMIPTNIPIRSSSFDHSDLSHNSGWNLLMQQENSFNKDLESFLQHHLNFHKNQLDQTIQYALNKCYQLTVKEGILHGRNNWLFFHSAKQHILTVLLPTIPDDAIVYEVEQQPIVTTKDIIGNMVLLIPEQNPNIFTVGTIVQQSYNTANDEKKASQLFAIKHERQSIQYDTFTLIIIPIQPFILFSLLDWIKYSLSHLDVNIFSPSLLPIFIHSKDHDKLIANYHQHHFQQSHQYYNGSVNNGNRYGNEDDEDEDDPHSQMKKKVPDYLRTYGLDVSCIMVSQHTKFIANVGEGIWPQLQEKYLKLPIDEQPELYALSASQVSSLQYALSHRYSIITGPPGFGKTHLASKVAELTFQALKNESIHQPIFVLSSSDTGLDNLLTKMMNTIPKDDIVRFGHTSDHYILQQRDGVRLSTFRPKDPLMKRYTEYMYALKSYRQQLKSLDEHRYQLLSHPDPKYLIDLLPMKYRNALMHQFQNTSDTLEEICMEWLDMNNSHLSQEQQKQQQSSLSILNKYNNSSFASSLPNSPAYMNLLNNISHQSTNIPPIIEKDHFNDQCQRMVTYKPKIVPISNGTFWPFEDKKSSKESSIFSDFGDRCREALMKVWNTVPVNNIWHIQVSERKRLYHDLMKVYTQHIDMVIHDTLKRQAEVLDKINNLRLNQWLKACHFTRVIGMTAEFAMANHLFVREIAPRVVIVDEAHDIPEALLLAIGLTSRTEHIVIFGEEQEVIKKMDHHHHHENDKYAMESLLSSSLNASIIQRWKESKHQHHQEAIQRLDTQMRIHPDIFHLWQAISTTHNHDDKDINYALSIKKEECIRGMVYPTYFVDYKYDHYENHHIHNNNNSNNNNSNNNNSNNKYKNGHNENNEEGKDQDQVQALNTCYFVAYLTHYINQQGHSASEIVILTLCPIKQQLIQSYLLRIASDTCFVNGLENIKVELLDHFKGKDASIVVLLADTSEEKIEHHQLYFSTSSIVTKEKIQLAISRARKGLYIIGRGCLEPLSPWYPLAKHMKDKGLLSDSIPLRCQTHPTETYSAGTIQKMIEIENGGCGEICTTLLQCGHCCLAKCHPLSHDVMKCTQLCGRKRPNECQHECVNSCYVCKKEDKCPPCLHIVNIELSCGHQVSAPCYQQSDISVIKCEKSVSVTLECGHTALIPCYKKEEGDLSSTTCHILIEKELDCSHVVKGECGKTVICDETCKGLLECGHPCHQLCRKNHEHDRSLCTYDCPKQLICGHYCTKGCANPDEHTERCLKKCDQRCLHGYQCGNPCWDVCISCIQTCPNKCPHFTCNKKCYEVCDRPPCNEKCDKVLSCGHKCRGYCGEPCTTCPTCKPDLVCPITLTPLSEFSDDELLYTLPECECTFLAEGLDNYFNTHTTVGKHTTVKLWCCPSCQKLVFTALRYNENIKKEAELVNEIKKQQETIRQQLTSEEKFNIINAMNQEINPLMHNIVGGRWFVCKNQHPYFIGDCGGATEVSLCPHCSEEIGGLQHKVVESNRFYGEFDGSQKPAWPGQPGYNEETIANEQHQQQPE